MIEKLGIAGLAGLAGLSAALADTIQLAPVRDNSIYEEAANSNGAGSHFFAGKTNSFHGRRGLIAFDVAGSLPAGAQVTGVTLTLRCSKTPDVAILDDHEFRLHRLLEDWGEAAADAGSPGGAGAPAEPGDATWDHRFFDTDSWTTAGGSYVATESAMIEIGSSGFYDWDSTPALVADVQGWLDAPASNFGWMLIGYELNIQTARRFDSREHPNTANRPLLSVEFDPPAAAAGAVPDGDDVPGSPLRLDKGPLGSLTLDWSSSCRASDVDYEVYGGFLGSFLDHTTVACSTAGATTYSLVPPAGIDAYFLIVPTDGQVEGSYGRDSQDVERSPGVLTCLPQLMGNPVCSSIGRDPL